MPTTVRLAKSLRPRKRERLPLFFEGRVRLQIIMAVSEYGPMRPAEIQAIFKDSKRLRIDKIVLAAQHLERLGIVHCQVAGPMRFTTIGLDRRHPAFPEIQHFGRALFRLYVDPMLRWKWRNRPVPSSRRPPITPLTPKHDPATLDMHVLGQRPRQKFLHLFAEIGSCPTFVARQFLGASHNTDGSYLDWARLGIIERRPVGRRMFNRLDPAYPAYRPLVRLLKKLNSFLPEYEALAAAYKREFEMGHYDQTWLIRQTRKRKFEVAPTKKKRDIE